MWQKSVIVSAVKCCRKSVIVSAVEDGKSPGWAFDVELLPNGEACVCVDGGKEYLGRYLPSLILVVWGRYLGVPSMG